MIKSSRTTKQLLCTATCVAGMLLSCSGTAPGQTAAGQTTTAADTATVEELPLPHVPEMLRTPADRAAYITRHFWDEMDFGDTLRSHNSAFVEQNFSNFISLFPHADKAARETAVATLLHKAEADTAAYVLLADIAEKYLYDPNSPMLSEDFYLLFLEKLAVSPLLGEFTAERYRLQRQAVRKNRPGTQAADFAYLTRDGRRTTLRKTPVSEQLLLLFYDPDCEHCRDVMTQLQNAPLLTEAVRSGRLIVVAVYADDDLDLWRRTAPALPASWIVGADTAGNIHERELYVLRAMPSLYLLDSRQRVVLKDAPLPQLFHYLQNSMQ